MRFDAKTLATVPGSGVPLDDRGALDRRFPGLAAISIADAGRLAYRRDGAVDREFVWRDRTGRVTGRIGAAERIEPYRFHISPDGQLVEFYRNVGVPTGSVWLIDAAGGPPRRFRDATQLLVWSPKGDEIAWTGAMTAGQPGVFRQPINRLMGEGDWLLPPGT